jgi:sugar O-acyltransferase (sialic acid O-acetyltransferase NeuD family)
MPRLVIFGVKNFAEMAHYYFTHDSAYSVAAFTVDGAYLEESHFQGLPVVPFEELEQHFPPGECSLFVAVGMGKVNAHRAEKVAAAEAKGYQLASFLSTRADHAPDLVLRPNTMIMERALILPFAQIGADTIIWPTTLVGFHSRVGDHCWLVAPTFGERVTIGDFTFIGLHATVSSFVTVGRRNILGAGALILHDTQDDQIYRGHASTSSKAPSYRLWSR